MMNNNLRIAIFDESKPSRDALVSLLGTEKHFEVVGVYNHFWNCIKNLHLSRPCLAIINITCSGTRSIAMVECLKTGFPQMKILIQASADDDVGIYHAILAGASAFISKNQVQSSLISVVKEIRAGGSPMSPLITERVLKLIRENLELKSSAGGFIDYKLTTREKEVLSWVVRGKSYKMVGAELTISYETVRTHMKKIYEKLDVASLTEVVAKAINYHIV